MYIQLFYVLELISLFVGMILPFLLAIVFFTVMEHYQTIRDFIKVSKVINTIFYLYPVFTFGLAMAG